MKKIVAVVCLCMMALVNVQAEGMYLGGYYYESDVDYDVTPLISLSAETSGIGIKAGYDFSDYFAAEFRYLADLQEGDVDFSGGLDGGVEIEEAMGLYLKGGIPIGGNKPFMKIYVIGGLTVADLSFTSNTTFGDFSESGNSASYGGGLEFNMGESGFFNIEYIDMYDADDVEIEMLSMGFNFYL